MMSKLILTVFVCLHIVLLSSGYPQNSDDSADSSTQMINSSTPAGIESTSIDSFGSSVTKLIDAKVNFATSFFDGIFNIGNSFMQFGTELVSKVTNMFNNQAQSFSNLFSGKM